MYGIYIIAIAFAGAATIFGIVMVILAVLSNKYEKKYERADAIYREHNYDPKYAEDRYKYAKKETTNHDGANVSLFVFVVCIALAITFAACGAIVVKSAEEEYEQFLATQDVFEQVYVAENELENIKLTETIIEMNHWLVEAKASKKTYGCLSRYYYLNVEDLEPIGKR